MNRVRTSPDFYILREGGVAEPAPSLIEWAEWAATHSTQIAEDWEGRVVVSTVFLGLNHRHFGDGPPILWETMIFGGRHNEWQQRYSSQADAVAGHARALAMVRETP